MKHSRVLILWKRSQGVFGVVLILIPASCFRIFLARLRDLFLSSVTLGPHAFFVGFLGRRPIERSNATTWWHSPEVAAGQVQRYDGKSWTVWAFLSPRTINRPMFGFSTTCPCLMAQGPFRTRLNDQIRTVVWNGILRFPRWSQPRRHQHH